MNSSLNGKSGITTNLHIYHPCHSHNSVSLTHTRAHIKHTQTHRHTQLQHLCVSFTGNVNNVSHALGSCVPLSVLKADSFCTSLPTLQCHINTHRV
uniref:Uncharacterized protein n=1 Tax=Anguilla anguilla TaxID=7936 RepID=A0A0E9WWV3_ANGAN